MPPLTTPLSPANTTQVVQEKNPTDRQSFWQTAVDRLLKSTTWDWPVVKQNGVPVLDQSNVGSGPGHLIAWDGAGKYPAGDGSQITNLATGAVHGCLIPGTPLVLNPIALSVAPTQAHGFASTPDLVTMYIECLIAEHGYAIGDRVFNGGIFNNQIDFGANSTLSFMVVYVTNPPQLNDRATHTNFNITVANWKAVVTPYKLS
jgi:hypothetical protein